MSVEKNRHTCNMAIDLDEFEFFEAEDNLGPAKATVRRSGRLGFSRSAAKMIDFEVNKFFRIGRKKDGGEDILFLIPVSEDDKSDFTFGVFKAGGYYSMKTKRLLSQLGIEYREDTVIFEIDEKIDAGKKYYKLTRRKKRSNNTKSTA